VRVATTRRFTAATRHIAKLCEVSGGDDRALRRAVLEVIGEVVAFDAYAWVTTDPQTWVGSAPLAEVPFLAELPRAIRLKYLTSVNRWTRLNSPVALLSESTRGQLSQSLMWRELLQQYGVVDAASAVYRDRYGCWGFLELWRAGHGRPFEASEAEFLAASAESITSALRHCQALTFTATPLTLPPMPAGPVVMLLSPDLAVRAQTAPVASYLATLVPPDAGAAPVPAGAYNVAAQLLAVEAGVDEHPALARVHLHGGVWLTMKAARIALDDDTDPAKSTDTAEHDIAVSIELAGSAERASLFARAYALSGREAELISQLAGGADTRAVAASMHLSEHTVQDHLKSVFTKTGLRSRRQLLSAITGM
jgi:DNA-binding CsgD family transcriptional regulator